MLKYQPYKAGQIINSVCVLHNIFGNAEMEDEVVPAEEIDEQGHNDFIRADVLRQGQQKRQQLIQQYFN